MIIKLFIIMPRICKITLIYSATYAGHTQLDHSEKSSRWILRKYIDFTSAVIWATKIRHVYHIISAILVQVDCMIGWIKGKHQCHLPYPWYGENQETTMLIVIFVMLIHSGFSVKNKHKIIYPNLDSSLRPIPHEDTLPIPFLPQECTNMSLSWSKFSIGDKWI